MTKKTENAPARLNMHGVGVDEIDLSADDAVLASMLAEMGVPEEDTLLDAGGADGAIVGESTLESAAGDSSLIDVNDVAAIEAIVGEIEKAEAIQGHYAEVDAGSDVGTGSGDAPKAEASATSKKKNKEPKAPRVTFVGHKPSEVLNARLGGKVGETLLLEVGDIELDPVALEAKQKDLLAVLNVRPGTGTESSTQKKVAEKIIMLFSWMKNGGKLNEVMVRTFKILARDGQITSGDKGNLHAELLAKPYSVGTCRAQAGQMMAMLPMLKIATKSEKGKLVANPDSLLLMKAKAELGLS